MPFRQVLVEPTGYGPRGGYADVAILGDVHYEAQGCKRELLDAWIVDVRASGAYWLCIGDLFDAQTLTAPGGIKAKASAVDLEDAMDRLEAAFLPIREKCLGMIPGNHEERISRFGGIDPIRQLTTRLEISYDPLRLALQLTFSKTMRAYRLYALHGYGGGRRMGSRANKLEDLSAVVDANIYVMGHMHTPMVFTDHKRVYTMTGSFLGYEGYPIRQGYKPSGSEMPFLRIYSDFSKIDATLKKSGD